MDSRVDYPVITSSKGQEGYARAISDALIKQLKLKKKSPGGGGSNPDSVKIGDKYTLKSNTPGYFTAADAKAGRNPRVNVVAGDYWVHNIANGMLNITRTKGTPGSWINPGTTSQPQQPVIGGKYDLKKNKPGYSTAADAKAGRNQRVTVLAGDYIVFNISDGMINISKTKGSPGSWINPK